ncbi:4-hydroxyphenylpyruvate dioxygenase-like putative hemolysin [Streptomyces luteogriseus]|uniref:4-hydroxyphenylpyruvate dioxygenase-like putative hemolysin n=1 Tax=Streptomyces luteogriseus TaxID=68233 RepID=A0A7W7DSY2_9ACTN|nr:4-hydroxyphenylpyruvate dioxygenase-like putative hemolysin [Streptomyces luteogriseus]
MTTNQNAVAREIRPRHAAFAVEDIVEAVRHVRAAGAELLRIPANYCDDLAAPYEFPDGELETYHELGILRDRDEQGGEFRRCYTDTVGYVFFEIVQRTGGYRGYGAAKAFVRFAAQRR